MDRIDKRKQYQRWGVRDYKSRNQQGKCVGRKGYESRCCKLETRIICSPFLVLTLLALILQLNIVFMIISFVIGSILIVIGLCPKIRSYRPKEILSPIKNQNESESCYNIDRTKLPSQNQEDNIDINI